MVPADLSFTHPLDCDSFNDCRINLVSTVDGTGTVDFFIDEGFGFPTDQSPDVSLDALTFMAELVNSADSAKLTVAQSDKKGANGISLAGVASTATAAGVNAEAMEDNNDIVTLGQAIPVLITAMDSGGLSVTDWTIYVNVDAAPVVMEQIADTTFDHSDNTSNTISIGTVAGYFKDPDSTTALEITAKSSNPLIVSTPALVSMVNLITGDLVLTVNAPTGTATITVRATEGDNTLRQYVEQTFTVTVQP